MKTELRLKRDLRRNILQGNPWVYSAALERKLGQDSQNTLVKLLDKKGKFLAWGFSDKDSPIAVRVITTQEQPPSESFFREKFTKALMSRKNLFQSNTNAFRLFNGEGDGLPGLVCDVYNNVAVLQFDGRGAIDFWNKDTVADWLLGLDFIDSVRVKARHDQAFEELSWGKSVDSEVGVTENGVRFLVDIVSGQKTGFFLDQRENREYVRQISKGKSVLNLFSYTGGFSLYSALGGAESVMSVDIASSALDLAKKNFELNEVDSSRHAFETADVFEFLKQSNQSKKDVVICDPPSMAPSEAKKPAAIRKYIEVFSDAAKSLTRDGDLLLSSCSSHISFSDFDDIVRESLSKARKVGRVKRVSGQGPDHPYPLACPELRYLKFYHLQLVD